MWELLQDCWKSVPHEAASPRVATLNNLLTKIYFDLFSTFLVTTLFHMCYFIVVMSSLLFYNVENSFFFYFKNLE